MNNTEKDQWRTFFLEADINRYLAKSILTATYQSIQLLEQAEIISGAEVKLKYSALQELLGSDVSEVFNTAYWSYKIESTQESKGIVAILNLARQKSREGDERLIQQLNMHYLRWRELIPLVRALKEIRNSAIHDLAREIDSSWLFYVSSCVFRFTYLSSAPRNDELVIERVRALSLKIIKSQLSADLEDKSEDDRSYHDLTQHFIAVTDRLDRIERSINHSKLFSEANSPVLDTQDQREEVQPPLETNEGSFLTEELLKERLLALREKIKADFSVDDMFSPSDNILQTAIINEIIKCKFSNLEEVLKVEDVKWRIEKKIAVVSNQMEKYKDQINDLLQKTAWDTL